MENLENYLQDMFSRFEKQFQTTIAELQVRNQPELAEKMRKRGYSIFHNNPLNVLKQGDTYFISLNPGGDDVSDFSNANDCLEFWKSRALNYSSFFDEKWDEKRANGKANNQLNFKRILGHVRGSHEEAAIRDTFSTNLYFYRSFNTGGLVQYPVNLLDCWQFHQEFLDIVKPKVVLCNGNHWCLSPFAQFYNKFGKDRKVEEEKVAERKYVRAFRAQDFLVIGVPHLSNPYASLDNIEKAIDNLRVKV